MNTDIRLQFSAVVVLADLSSVWRQLCYELERIFSNVLVFLTFQMDVGQKYI